ncbi:MAG: hypothetical protein KAI43_04635 [Candidatus Aureabacteria bacterium]|nr:hypothetical protein [Candidatus Auribacterota bacterium]
MEHSLKEKIRLEKISEYFLTNKNILDNSIGILSYQDTSIQTFIAAHVAGHLIKKGIDVTILDLFQDFPNTKCFFDKNNILESNVYERSSCISEKPEYVKQCKNFDEITIFLEKEYKKETSNSKNKRSVLLNIPFDATNNMWQVLKMVRNVVIITNDKIDALLRTSNILKKLFSKNTISYAGIVFGRIKKKNDPMDFFEKICKSVNPEFSKYIINLGTINSCQEIFHSLLAGRLVFEDHADSEIAARIKCLIENLYAHISMQT